MSDPDPEHAASAPTNPISTTAPSEEELKSKHRKELRDLQARITQKKKQATKKTRKGVNDECDALERELKDRQTRERAELEAESAADTDANSDEAGPDEGHDDLAAAADGLKVEGKNAASKGVEEGDGGDLERKGKKSNRQKARLARRAAEQTAAAEAAAVEASSMTDYKAREQEVISAAIEARGLVEHRVRSDGHCLYAAMADQLEQAKIPLEGEKKRANGAEEDYRVVRREVAEWVLRHPDDYLPFLDEEDMEKGIEGYARKIGETGEWGGQLEIVACARRWEIVVNVLQGDGRVERIEGGGEGAKGGEQERECWLAYYKHSFGLGEHYNSLRKKS